MVQNDKLTVSALQNEQHRRLLSELLRQEGNRRCADCHARGPTWASVNLGVFMCLNCSGIHRSLGVHNSKVRSTNLDTWLPEQVAFVRAVGNVRGCAFYEAQLPSDFQRPAEADMLALRIFITDKYVNRKYCAQGFKDPPTIENYTTHPFLLSLSQEGSLCAQGERKKVRQPNHVSSTMDPLGLPAPGAICSIPQSAQKPTALAATSSTISHPAQIDLLSLDEPCPSQAPTAAAPSVVGGLSENSAVGSWDLFLVSASAGVVPQSRLPGSNKDTVPKQQQQQQHKQDPFDTLASIERSFSSSSLTQPTQHKNTNGSGVVTNAHAVAESDMLGGGDRGGLPPPTATDPVALMASVPAVQPYPPVSSTIGGGGLANAMRVCSTHSKGSLSHEDILAMFDK